MTDTAQPNADPQSEPAQDRAGGQQATPPEPKFTQSDLDFFIAKEKAEIQRKFSDYDALKAKATQLDELKQAELTELEKAQQIIAAKDAELAAAKQAADAERLNALRLRVGQEAGLPSLMSSRLQGATEEELKADAEAIKGILGVNGGIVPPNIDATSGGGQSAPRGIAAKLTPQQRQIAELYNMSLEDYAKSLQQFEE